MWGTNPTALAALRAALADNTSTAQMQVRVRVRVRVRPNPNPNPKPNPNPNLMQLQLDVSRQLGFGATQLRHLVPRHFLRSCCDTYSDAPYHGQTR